VSVSPRIRIIALVGVVAAVGLLLAFMVLGRGSSASAAPHQINAHPFGAKPAAKHAAVKTAAVPLAPPTVKALSAKLAASAKKHAVKAVPVVGANGLPGVVNAALAQRLVAVVLVYDPLSSVDKATAEEAQAGAKSGGASFVRIDTHRAQQVRALTDRFGVLPQPAVLVFRGSGKLYVQLSGYADKDTIAQAAENAARLSS
jgi:hypothetical protein